MLVTHSIEVNLTDRKELNKLHMVQGDRNTRAVEITLLEGENPWQVPEEAVVLVRYRKPDGTGGIYDTLPDGTAAWSIADDKVTVILAPQMLTVPGCVAAQVELQYGGGVLATFTIQIIVEWDPSLGVLESEDYVNWSQWAENTLNSMLEQAKESGDFTGPVGPTPQLTIGTVTTLPAGSDATATLRGTAEAPILDLGIPHGTSAVDTTLSQSGQAADAAATGEALAGKAPAGYIAAWKLVSSEAELETAVQEMIAETETATLRYYILSISVTGLSLEPGNWKVEIIRTSSAIARIIASKAEKVLVRVYTGTLSGWAWVTPPLTVGKEYRTAEAFMSKPVYSMVVDCGALPSASSKGITYAASGVVDMVISAQGITADGRVFPTRNIGSTLGAHEIAIDTTRTDITIRYVGTSLAGTQAYMLLKYTKQAD